MTLCRTVRWITVHPGPSVRYARRALIWLAYGSLVVGDPYPAYAIYDLDGVRAVLTSDIEWTIPGHHALSGTKRGVEEVAAFFTQLGKAGFQAEPLFLGANEEYVVDIHRGWTTEGTGQVAEGKVDRVINLSGDQHFRHRGVQVTGSHRLEGPATARSHAARPRRRSATLQRSPASRGYELHG